MEGRLSSMHIRGSSLWVGTIRTLWYHSCVAPTCPDCANPESQQAAAIAAPTPLQSCSRPTFPPADGVPTAPCCRRRWRPEFGRRFTPVAMLQLASPTVALLVRTCSMQYRLPGPLRDFLADPAVCLLGFHWDGADDGKMQVGVCVPGRAAQLARGRGAIRWPGMS